MHGTTLRITAAALGLAALAAAPTSGALADAKKDGYGYSSQVCYKVGSGYDRLVLNIKPESSLNFQGGYPQVVWTAEGKYVSVYGNYPDMAVADGAVVTTKSGYQSYGNYYKGAHLGVDVPGTNYAFNCTSPYESPTPGSWSCKDGSTLTQVNDSYCGFFKDSGYTGK